jgi:hypothetical protein
VAANCKATFREATSKDARDWYGMDPPMSFRGYVAEVTGEVVGIGGVFYMNGIPIVFSDMKKDKRLDRKSIVRAIRLLIQLIDSNYRIVFAFPSDEEKTSKALLVKLGFNPSGDFVPGYGPVYMRRV